MRLRGCGARWVEEKDDSGVRRSLIPTGGTWVSVGERPLTRPLCSVQFELAFSARLLRTLNVGFGGGGGSAVSMRGESAGVRGEAVSE